MRVHFPPRERFELLKSWAAISLAFAIVMVGTSLSLQWLLSFAIALAISAVTVGLGFLVHEVAHKWVAVKEACHAEYRADDRMLLLALVTSLFGIVIAAPGAVHVSGHADHTQQGKTAVAGPAANLLLALLFLALFLLGEGLVPGWLAQAAGFGSVINAWFALFNMLPFNPFDGAKVLAWSKVAYGGMIGLAALLTFFQIPLGLF